MYLITCSYGTRQIAWTRRAALEWLACCGDVATVTHRLTGRVVAVRIQPSIA